MLERIHYGIDNQPENDPLSQALDIVKSREAYELRDQDKKDPDDRELLGKIDAGILAAINLINEIDRTEPQSEATVVPETALEMQPNTHSRQPEGKVRKAVSFFRDRLRLNERFRARKRVVTAVGGVAFLAMSLGSGASAEESSRFTDVTAPVAGLNDHVAHSYEKNVPKKETIFVPPKQSITPEEEYSQDARTIEPNEGIYETLEEMGKKPQEWKIIMDKMIQSDDPTITDITYMRKDGTLGWSNTSSDATPVLKSIKKLDK